LLAEDCENPRQQRLTRIGVVLDVVFFRRENCDEVFKVPQPR
jgi:hypothetical protein